MKKTLCFSALVLSLASCGESQENQSSNEKIDDQKEHPTVADEETSQSSATHQDTLLTIVSANYHSQDYESFQFHNGKVEVRSHGKVVDKGSYNIKDQNLHLNLLSQELPVIYQWKQEDESQVQLIQEGTQQVLNCQLKP